MNRRLFLTLTSTGIFAMTNSNTSFDRQFDRMPVLFIGHGSPMNALANNAFTEHLRDLGRKIPQPKKILMISAHWTTRGVRIMGNDKPKMIYDFYGFPKELYEIKYPALGDERLAGDIKKFLVSEHCEIDFDWGYDHGAWTILKHMYPNANIPVIQLSLNENILNLKDHLELAAKLKKLREEGVLIIGSGNIVHNLGLIDRDPSSKLIPDWALEFDDGIKTALLTRNQLQLVGQGALNSKLWKLAHPTIEHYLPLLYAFGATDQSEKVTFPFEGFEHGSLSMRSVLIS